MNDNTAKSVDRVVCVDGELVRSDSAVVPIADRGFTIGDGLFETIGVVRGRPFQLDRHLQRLERSCDALGIDAPNSEDLAEDVERVISANWHDLPMGAGRLRITVSGGTPPPGTQPRGAWRGGPPTVVIVGEPSRALPDTNAPSALTVTTGPFLRNPDSPIAGHKVLSYVENVLALRWAIARGFDEYVFSTHSGALSEGSRTNVLASVDGSWITPTLTTGCLPGIGRELMIEAGIVTEHDVVADSTVDELVLISASGGVRFATAVSHHRLSTEPGPLALAAWGELERLRSM